MPNIYFILSLLLVCGCAHTENDVSVEKLYFQKYPEDKGKHMKLRLTSPETELEHELRIWELVSSKYDGMRDVATQEKLEDMRPEKEFNDHIIEVRKVTKEDFKGISDKMKPDDDLYYLFIKDLDGNEKYRYLIICDNEIAEEIRI